jgi:DNA primase
MHFSSSQWKDLRIYKTKEILLSVIGASTNTLRKANKSGTFYVCLCPFHLENTPSMKIFHNVPMGGWGYKCFGCGKSGDVFTFLMKQGDMPFWEALAIVKKYTPTPYIGPNQITIPFPKF